MLDYIKLQLDSFYPEFPRVFMMMINGLVFERKAIGTFEDAITKAWRFNGQNNLYLGVYSEHDKELKSVDRIYFDFDSPNIDLALSDMLKADAFLRQEFGGEPLKIVSGSKGYNMYLMFNPILLEYPNETLREFCEDLKKRLKLSTMDLMVAGDTNRVSRIPYFINPKSGNVCYPWHGRNDSNIKYPLIWRNSDLKSHLRAIDDFIADKKNNEPEMTSIPDTHEDLESLYKIWYSMGDGLKRFVFAILAPSMAKQLTYNTAVHIMHELLHNSGRTKLQSYFTYQLKNAYKKEPIPWNLDTFALTYPDIRLY